MSEGYEYPIYKEFKKNPGLIMRFDAATTTETVQSPYGGIIAFDSCEVGYKATNTIPHYEAWYWKDVLFKDDGVVGFMDLIKGEDYDLENI